MFVVCVPTKEHESELLEQQQPRRIASTGSFGDLGRAAETLGGVRLSTRSKSEDSLFVSGQDSQDERVGQKPGQEGGGSQRREMFIGPWRVDASDLPSRASLTPGSRRGRAESHGYTPAGAGLGPGLGPGRRSRSPLLDTANISRSEPDGLGTRQADTPYSNYKRRRHRFLESELEKILQELKIHNAVWCMGRSSRFYQVLFSIESGDPCEEALQKLAERGIGVLLNSVVSVLPCVLYYQGSEKSGAGSEEDLANDVDKDRDDECPGSTGTGGGGGRSKAAEQGTWERFVQSVRARLTVAQVVEGVRANATFNFDFLLLVTVAAFVAALGLFEDSTIILVASTLISPLMGPVMAATFGTMIRDWQLQRMGLINECVGLLHCLVIAFVTGVAVSLLDQPMPTAAMVDGGLLRSLWVNVLIATLSGMGIAIALLRDNTGSLVGVAISASLLPPAVNAGLLWAMSLVYYMLEPLELERQERGAQYTSFFSDRPEIEMAVLGGVSLCTTFINIVFVYITGILMLKVKEVAPNSQAHQRFWKHDVKIARDYNATLYGASAAEMLRSVVNQENCGRGSEECCDRPKMDEAPLTPELARLLQLSSGFSSHFGGSGGVGRGRHANPRYLDVCDHQLTWSPSTFAAADPHHDLHHQQQHQHGDTVRELEGLYRTIRHQHQLRQQQQQHHLAAASGQGNSRRSSFGSGTTAASWRLGRSDGYRCSLNKTPQGHGSDCRCFSRRSRRGVSTTTTTTTASATTSAAAAGDAAGAVASPAVALTLTMCTPPFNNMPVKQSVLFPDPGDAWTTTPVTTRPPPVSVSAFKTPLAAIADGTPPSAFMTPVDSSAPCPPTAPRTVMTVDNETAAPVQHRRPSKTRRFVVTKADDTEVLLPRK